MCSLKVFSARLLFTCGWKGMEEWRAGTIVGGSIVSTIGIHRHGSLSYKVPEFFF